MRCGTGKNGTVGKADNALHNSDTDGVEGVLLDSKMRQKDNFP